MPLQRFQDFLSSLVSSQRRLFSLGQPDDSLATLLEKLMGTNGEVSAAIVAREVLDKYAACSAEEKLEFFHSLEQDFNADMLEVKAAYHEYEKNPSSHNLNVLAKTSEPRRVEILRRLNQTPGATHDLVAMRYDLIGHLRQHPELKSVDQSFVRLFTAWFSRSFLTLQTIDWSTSAAILERIIRYEAVHAIKDWTDLRNRIDRPDRRCFAFFHPSLIDEPLIFVEVALSQEIPSAVAPILDIHAEPMDPAQEYTVATFYRISNCQPGLKAISFGNFLIKQVVQELQAEFPGIKHFVTLSPIPGFDAWLKRDCDDEEAWTGLSEARERVRALQIGQDTEKLEKEDETLLRKVIFHYLYRAKRGSHPLDPVARFHLGNGALLHRVNILADLSESGLHQSRGVMVNYLYDLSSIEANHERYVTEGTVQLSDKLASLAFKPSRAG